MAISSIAAFGIGQDLSGMYAVAWEEDCAHCFDEQLIIKKATGRKHAMGGSFE